MRWSAISAAVLVLMACSSAEHVSSLDAGVAPAPLLSEDARTLRRHLREAPEPNSTPLPTPGDKPAAAAIGPQTFAVPAPISPMPDGSGRFVMRRANWSTFFTSSGFAWSLSAGARDGRGRRGDHVEERTTGSDEQGWGVHCTLVTAREGAVRGDRQGKGRVHHYVGAKHAWATNLPTYESLVWEDAWAGIDMVAVPARGGMAYRFVLSPGANVSDVRMRWHGASAVRVVEDGRGLEVETGIGVLHVRGLRAFAGMPGQPRTELAVRHHLHVDSAGSMPATDVGFAVDGWDGSVPLVIDPTVSWSSFPSGTGEDGGSGIAVDGSGNALVTGSTMSSDFPSVGGFKTTFGAYQDAFVTKINSTGGLVWSSYLGGLGGDAGLAITVDKAGAAFVTGFTFSKDFPSDGGFKTTTDEYVHDAFVTKVSSVGTLVWSSYLGGSGIEFAYGIAVDGGGNALVTGYTTSPDFPSTGGFQTTLGGSEDGFVTKVSSAGALVWSSYLGGNSLDRGGGIAVDSSGNVFVAGQTESTNFPSAGGFQTTFLGVRDAFVTKVSGAGALVWSSYLGGTWSDWGTAVAVDGSGDAFVTGGVSSPDFPTSGGFLTKKGGPGNLDAFVTKVSGAGALLWSSYLGGSGTVCCGKDEFGAGIAVDGSGNVVVAGSTESPDFPSTGGFKTTRGGTSDGFVTKVSGTGALLWSSYLGGSLSDSAVDVTADGFGNIFVVGSSVSGDFGASGSPDAYVAKIGPGALLGAPCAAGYECASLTCVDSVCCDKACTGDCEACTLAKKGSGADGSCGVVAADTNPRGRCAKDSGYPANCLSDGLCDGAGGCRTFAKKGTPCDLTTCSGGFVSGKACTGVSATCASTTTACAPFVCGADACKIACAGPSDCASDAFCAPTGLCEFKRKDGQPCEASGECTSGNCVDAVCCNGPCNGQCEACNLPSSIGSCAPVTGKPIGATRKPCDGAGTVCEGTCDGKVAEACGYPPATTTCGKCTGARVPYCDGKGGCSAPVECDGHFACAGEKCASTCVGDSACVAGHRCSEGKCWPDVAKCSPDRKSSIDSAGSATKCSPVLCDVASGLCGAVCKSTADCVEGTVCDSTNRCTAPTPLTSDSPTSDGGGCSQSRGLPGAMEWAGCALLLALGCRRRARRPSD